MPFLDHSEDPNMIQIVLGYGDVGIANATFGNQKIAGAVFVPLDQEYESGSDLDKDEFLTKETPKILLRIDNEKGIASLRRIIDFAEKVILGKEITINMEMINNLLDQTSKLKQENDELKAKLLEAQIILNSTKG